MFPGPNRALGGAGPGPEGSRRPAVKAWVKGSGAGRPWAALGGGWVCGAGGLESWVQAGYLTVVGVPRTRSAARPVFAMRSQQAPVSGKVFIQRDYSSGTRCQFQTKFPAELENRVCSRAPRTCSGASPGASPGAAGSADLGGAGTEAAWAGDVRRGPLSKTWCLEEKE